MRRRLNVLGLTLTSVLAGSTSAAAAPPLEPLSPTQPKPKAIEPTGPATPIPNCSGHVDVRLAPRAVEMVQARGDRDLGDKGQLRMRATIRPTKRRLRAWLMASVIERDGDTRYTGIDWWDQDVAVPPGCEIATVNLTTGTASDGVREGDARKQQREVAGHGLIEAATCATDDDDGLRVRCSQVRFRSARVTFRPAVTDCSDYRVEIPMLQGFPLRGHGDIGGHSRSISIRSTSVYGGTTTAGFVWRIGVVSHPQKHYVGNYPIVVPEQGSYQGGWQYELINVERDTPGCRIQHDSRLSMPGGSLDGGASGHNHDSKRFSADVSGALREAWCVTDTDGDDLHDLGCAEIRLRSVVVHLEPGVPEPPATWEDVFGQH